MSARFWGRLNQNLRVAGESITWVTVVVGYFALMTMSETAAVAKTKARAYCGAGGSRPDRDPCAWCGTDRFGDTRSQGRPSSSIAEGELGLSADRCLACMDEGSLLP
jgi:hypothetical protein